MNDHLVNRRCDSGDRIPATEIGRQHHRTKRQHMLIVDVPIRPHERDRQKQKTTVKDGCFRRDDERSPVEGQHAHVQAAQKKGDDEPKAAIEGHWGLSRLQVNIPAFKLDITIAYSM